MSQRRKSKNGQSTARSNGEKPRTKSQSGGRVTSRSGGGDMFGSGLGNPRAPDIIDSLTDASELPDFVLRMLRTEFHKGHALANYRERDVIWRKWGLQNTREMVEGHFPPKESIWQGEIRKEAGLNDGRRALTPEQRQQLRDAIDLAYSYSTRSGPEEGMAQQRLLADQTQERRVVEERTDEGKGGWLSKLVG